jgi:hypothetical protein
MHVRLTLLGLLLIATPAEALAQAQPHGPIWKSGRNSIVVTLCPPSGDHDVSCRTVEVRQGDTVVRLGSGYMRATLL